MTRQQLSTVTRRVALTFVATGVLLAGVAGSPRPADAHSPNPVFAGGPFAQNADLRFRWGAGGTPPTVMQTAIRNAAAGSNASRKSKAPTFTYDAAGGNTVYYGVDVPCGINGLACFRRDAPTWFGVWIRPNGHRFDWGTLRWCEMTGYPDGCYDAENIVLDEFGHVHGVDHHLNFADESDYGDAVVQTYARVKPRAGWGAHVFGRCDVATLQQLYDVATWSTLYSTCLGIDTTTTLTASATSVVEGTLVTFTARLASAGTGRLAGNPMAGRVVVLQVRSGTAWADVLTMGAGSTAGSYVASLTIRTSADYRAIYRRTTTEGTRGSVSPVVAIKATVACYRLCPLFTPPADQ